MVYTRFEYEKFLQKLDIISDERFIIPLAINSNKTTGIEASATPGFLTGLANFWKRAVNGLKRVGLAPG